jgi:flagellin-like protein
MDKKALSNVVAYVLLIVITISLSALVYGWLTFYFSEPGVRECSDDVNVVVDGYSCISGEDGGLNVTLKNKGLFGVDGYTLRIHNRTNAEFGIYTLNDSGVALAPGEKIVDVYNFAGTEYRDVTLVEVQPFLKDGGNISCRSSVIVKVDC